MKSPFKLVQRLMVWMIGSRWLLISLIDSNDDVFYQILFAEWRALGDIYMRIFVCHVFICRCLSACLFRSIGTICLMCGTRQSAYCSLMQLLMFLWKPRRWQPHGRRCLPIVQPPPTFVHHHSVLLSPCDAKNVCKPNPRVCQECATLFLIFCVRVYGGEYVK